MRGLLQISPLHLRTFRTIILSTKGGRGHAAEIALITHGESLAPPRDNPMNLIRLGPAEGWFLTGWVSPPLVLDRLQPGERLVWFGKADPWAAASRSMLPLAVMTAFMCLAVIGGWNAYHSPKQHPGAFETAVLFAMIGALYWFFALKGFLKCWATAYALTDRRLIIAVGAKAQSFPAAALVHICRIGNAKRGSLLFGGPLFSMYASCFGGVSQIKGLYGIADPVRVEALIYETLIMPKKEGEQG